MSGVRDSRAKDAARVRPLPRWLRPQLATLVDRVPEGADWLHEIKYDGYRVVCRLEGGAARLYSRNGNDLTPRMAAVARAIETLSGVGDAWLDGEVVALQADGRTSFAALQSALSEGRDQDMFCYLFDLPYANGEDLTRQPLIARKQRLAAAFESSTASDARVRYSDHLHGDGTAFYAQACRFGLEGVISKWFDATYCGGRGRAWVKTKCRLRQEFVVGGFTAPKGARRGFGALVLGAYDENGVLRYAGRAGTGFDATTLARLRDRLEPIASPDPPFAHALPREIRKGVTWTRPELVIEADFAGWTHDGLVRQASFRGVREDKAPGEVVPEVPEPLTPPGESANAAGALARVSLSRRDKILYPDQGLTKADLASYYARVAERMLPYLAHRPLTLLRCPDGRHKACFFQRHAAAGTPAELLRVPLAEADGGEMRIHLAVDSLDGVLALVQMGVLEIHAWGARVDRPDAPDRLVFDLDPDPALPWAVVREGAALMRARLGDLGLTGFLRTTGGKGLHVVVPLARRHGWVEVKAFARALAEDIARRDAARYTARLARASRAGRIFIDYLRNARGASAIANYSTRARPGAPVAVPVAWEELTPALRPERFNVVTVPERLRSLPRDPWEGFEAARRPVTASMKRALGLRD